MKFDLAILGYGVIGVESLYALVSEGKKRKLNVAVIEKETKNIQEVWLIVKSLQSLGFQ